MKFEMRLPFLFLIIIHLSLFIFAEEVIKDPEFARLFEENGSNVTYSDLYDLVGIKEEIEVIFQNESNIDLLTKVIQTKIGLSEDLEDDHERKNDTNINLDTNEFSSEVNSTLPVNNETVNMQKRLFRNKHGAGKGLGKMKSVLKSVGATVKSNSVRVKEFLKTIIKKLGSAAQKIKEKLKKAIARAKKVFTKAKKSKSLVFIKETVVIVYKNVPENVKDMVVDGAVGLVIGGAGDITQGLEDIDFDPSNLEDDDLLALDLGDEFDDLDEDLDKTEEEAEKIKKDHLEDGDIDLDEINDDIFDDEELAVIKGKHNDLLPLSQVNKALHNQHEKCCCLKVDGISKSADELSMEELDKVDPNSLPLLDGLDNLDFDLSDLESDEGSPVFNITISDFDEKALESETDEKKEVFEKLADIDYELEEDDEQFLNSITKRSIKKRSLLFNKRQCKCSQSALMKREIAQQLNNKKHGKRTMPSLTSAIPVDGSIALLKAAKISTNNLCTSGDLKRGKKDCVDLSGVRLGALGAIFSMKLLCPSCDIVILDAGAHTVNPFLSGWRFEIKSSPELDVFLYETMQTYDGQSELYDMNKNRWSVINQEANDGKDFRWELIAHL